MKRNIEKHLTIWKDSTNRKPLLLRGARQVGKTYSIRQLGRSFDHFLEVNFEEELLVRDFFKTSLNPESINEKLAAYFGKTIIPQKTLLFFDEIQACPQAMAALRFYYEKMPELHVVAAGSLLEFSLNEIPSFGVGRISHLFMYPLNFNEFLNALGDDKLAQTIKKSNSKNPMDESLHQLLLERYRIYQTIGGMPAVLSTYVEQKKDLRACQKIIDEILTSLMDDFAKYKKKSPVTKLREVFYSTARQAGNKFKYVHIVEEGSQQGYKEALELLILAGFAYKVFHTSAHGIPLGAQVNLKKFKVVPSDLGFMQRLLGLDLAQQVVKKPVDFINKGNLAEVFVGLELLSNANPHHKHQLFYWHREAKSSNAEVDYVIQKNEEIIPLEVKAGHKGQMQSLYLFLEQKNLPYGIRISQENFNEYNLVKTYPIYAVGNVLE